jgi:hypothetical protein
VVTFFYLTLAADYGEPSLRDPVTPVDLDEVGLSEGLLSEIHKWNDDYQWVVPLSATERAQRSQEIAELDSRGLTLCDRIAVEIMRGTEVPKVEYYSEGQLRRLR